MKIRVVFGYLFFLLSVVLCAAQLFALSSAEHIEAVPLILQACSTTACLLFALPAGQSGHKTAMAVISVIAFGICFLALLVGGLMAMKASSETATIKFVVFLVYGGLYGFFGLIFSLIAGKSSGDVAEGTPTKTE
jgi:hypothetical protein